MKKNVRIILIIVTLLLLVPPMIYVVSEQLFYLYVSFRAEKLIKLDEKGLLSTKFGAAWQEVVYGESYQNLINGATYSESPVVEGVQVKEYPSIAVVEKLNSINYYSSKIRIEDRKGRQIAVIRTDHQRVSYKDFPQTLVQSVVASEDRNFFRNNHGFEFSSFIRAAIVSLFESIESKKRVHPRGTSTITQQVAKMFISQIDSDGNRHVSRTVDRKLREIYIAAALRKKYSPEEIMEIYLNHCLTSSYGLIGAEEVSHGLLGKSVEKLSDAESVYLSRMVKWGANIPDRIKKQCAIDMKRICGKMKWSQSYCDSVLVEINEMEFKKPEPIVTSQPHLVDLANLCWLQFLEKQGFSESRRRELNLLDPSSLIRKKGNVTIRLTIDLPLQEFITKQVVQRGYADSLMVTDIRIGSSADTISGKMPRNGGDQWKMRVLTKRELFSDPASSFTTALSAGDTLYTNTVYDRENVPEGSYRKVSRYYRRGKIRTEQQYAYGAIDAESGKLRAYVSRDRLGSGCAGLFDRPLANGNSTILPVLGAIMFDLGEFSPSGKWDDRLPVSDSVPWQRSLSITADSGESVVFADGTRLMNSDSLFHGDKYLWEHMANQNRILTAEMVLRLNQKNSFSDSLVSQKQKNIDALIHRMGISADSFGENGVTGVQIVKELVRLVGGSADTLQNGLKPIPVGENRYSSVCSDMELTLLEQMHLFNSLYRGMVVTTPESTLPLFVESFIIQGDTFNINSLYPIKRVNLLQSEQSLRPIQLGLFERGTWSPFDPLITGSVSDTDSTSTRWIEKTRPVNFCSIGYSDPRRPFTFDRNSPAPKVRWGILNGIVAVNGGAIAGDSVSEKMVLTIGAVGEWRRNMVPSAGENGTQLHQFLIDRLLRQYGTVHPKRVKNPVDGTVTVQPGFYNRYRHYLDSIWKNDSLRMVSAVDSSVQNQMVAPQ